MVENSPTTRASVGFRLRGLDGLRALGAIAVFGYHLLPAWLPGGFVGVDMFFVISGFLITGLLIREKQNTGNIDVFGFWVRRFRRLVPAVTVTVLITVPVAWLVSRDLMVGIGRQMVGALTYSYNWLDIATGQSYFERGNPPLLRNMWSLAVEQQFYLVWPIVMLLLLVFPKQIQTLFALGVAGVSVALMYDLSRDAADFTRVYQGTDTHIFGIMLGAALAFAVPHMLSGRPQFTSPQSAHFRGVMAWAALGTIVASWLLIEDGRLFVYPLGLLLVSALMVIVIQGLAVEVVEMSVAASLLVKFLDSRFMVWLGERSYSLYLWHWPIIVITRSLFPSLGLPALIVTAVSISVALAALSYRFVETPMRRDGIANTIKVWFRIPPHSERPRIRILAPILAVAVLVSGYTYIAKTSPEKSSAQIMLEAAEKIPQVSTPPSHPSSNPPLSPAKEKNSKDNSQQTPPKPLPQVPGDQVFVIGDSVALASIAQLQETFPGIGVDAKVSRFPHQALGIIQQYINENRMRPYLVIALSTNGNLTFQQVEAILNAIGDRKLVLVTGFGPTYDTWIAESNGAISQAAQAYPSRVRVADWNAAIAAHQNLLAGDGVHPSPEGGRIFARVIKDALDSFLLHTEPYGQAIGRQSKALRG